MSQNANRLVASVKDNAAAEADHLSHGAGCYSDDPDRPNECDWRTRIIMDKPIGTNRRFVMLKTNHLTGSGAWDVVRVYGCAKGKARVLYANWFLYGVTVKSITPHALVFIHDHREKTVVWDAKQHAYRKPLVTFIPKSTN